MAAKAIPAGQTLSEPKILFQRVEDAQIQEEIQKLHALSKQTPKASAPMTFEPLKELIDINVFKQLDLRVGVVTEAEVVEKSKKLLKLQVDLGFEKRTIVSGISQAYKPDEIIGKKVVVVANLKPATLMGIESQGMLLAGHSTDGLEVVSLSDLPPGSTVT